MGLSFDILIFDCLLKAPQPITGLFLIYFSPFRTACSQEEMKFCTQSRDFQLSPILIHFPDVNIDGAPRCCRLIFPHRCCTISSFLLSLQTELKNKSKMRAVLQAISLPSRSVKKNIESTEKQYQSKSILSLSV